MLGTHIELDVNLALWELREKCSYYMSAGHSREGVSALGRCQVGGLWEEGDRLDSSGDSLWGLPEDSRSWKGGARESKLKGQGHRWTCKSRLAHVQSREDLFL